MNQPLGIGDVLSDAYQRLPRATSPAIAYLIGLVVVEYLLYQYSDPTAWSGWHVLGFFVVQNWLWWSIIAAALKARDGYVGLSGFKVSIVMFIQLLIVTIVMTIPIALGAILLLIPGIYLMLRWSQMAPAIISGHAQWFGALGESTRLTQGTKLRILACLIIPFLFALPLEFADQFKGDPTAYTFISFASFVVTSIVSVYIAFVIAAIYDQLRASQQTTDDSDSLASVPA